MRIFRDIVLCVYVCAVAYPVSGYLGEHSGLAAQISFGVVSVAMGLISGTNLGKSLLERMGY